MMEKLTLYLYFCVFVVGVFGSQLNLTDSASAVCEHCSNVTSDVNIEQEIMRLLDSALETDSYQILKGITLHKVRNSSAIKEEGNERSGESSGEKILNRLQRFAESRALEVKVPEVLERARLFSKQLRPRFAFGKNSFLTGFGLGFLAFGLKKLLLPLFIGAQIVKSILIAMFLPSILGGIGKLVGKGVTSFASSSGSSGGGAAADTTTDFDFKDNISYDNEPAGSDNYGVWAYPPNMLQNAIGRQPFPAYTSSGIAAMPAPMALVSDRYQQKLQNKEPIGSANHQGSFYSREKQQDFKIFHNMPSSSQLLTNYDPFYSPLLSRLDSIFKQLGYTTENCRERLVCDMYSNPAKFAPYSNLVSAQLSRELNELRKPSSDNPEILRFFRYMKAAKDGQDGNTCDLTYAGCTAKGMENDNPPMVTTFNDINKLVLARKLN